jgi:Uncharacterized protein family UPF0029
MADRRVAKAAHPIINAWKCQVGNVLYQGGRHCPVIGLLQFISALSLDNDDDGESAAGGRLAQLLQILVGTSLS